LLSEKFKNKKSTTMSRKNILLAILSGIIVLAVACNSNDKSKENATSDTSATTTGTGDASNPKGVGPHQNVQLTHPLDEKMIAEGQNTYNVKCGGCHKLTNEKLVGPGWKGVTDRRTPEWIMNFVTNTEEMLEKDTAAQNMLEVCLVKMPDQNLAENDARAILEFMRKNDGKQ